MGDATMLNMIFEQETMKRSDRTHVKSRPMQRRIIILSCVLAVMMNVATSSWASGDGVVLQHANNDVSNIGSLQRGARNFVNYCMGCHSAKYVRYNRLAKDLQISEEQLIENLMFAGGKPHDTMQISMPAADAARWFGTTPPDLSLIARSRGPDFLYTFLKTFYIDESRPTGFNNLIMDSVAMPHVLWELQGTQRAIFEEHEHGSEFMGFEPVTAGSLSAEEYDQFVLDLVNFLEYIGEPVQLERRQLGIWVLIFLLVFGLFAYALKQEIWSDVK
jgi:ubiquinol-cytochrome c reductase cytochrome c1 subunit